MLCDQMLSVKKRESERETVPLLMDGNGCHIRCNRSSGRNDTFYAFDKWFCHQIRMNWCPWWNNTHARTHTPSAEHYANICEWGEKLPSRFSFIFVLFFRTWTLSLAIFGERMDANGRGESRGKKVDWETGIKRMNEMISIYMYSRPLFSPKLNIVSKFSSVIEWCFCTWCRWLLYMRCW